MSSKRKHYKQIAEFPTGDIPVALLQRGPEDFSVVYGADVRLDLSYTEAAYQLGCCIMHALACASRIDSSTYRDI